jgi:hypothetical protein
LVDQFFPEFFFLIEKLHHLVQVLPTELSLPKSSFTFEFMREAIPQFQISYCEALER